MNQIIIADATLRSGITTTDNQIGFKEKIEIVKLLDRLHVDVIETAPLLNGKSDVLFLHAIQSLINGVLSCPAPLDAKILQNVWEAIKGAKHPRLHLIAPVSTVQMEYLAHQKPPMVLESIGNLTALAKSFGAETEVSLLDATRAEHDFLIKAAEAAVDNGADIITVCDSAGTLFPMELLDFVRQLINDVPKLKKVKLSLECSNALHMANASALACLETGITQIKTVIGNPAQLDLCALADVLRARGSAFHATCSLNMTALHKLSEQIKAIIQGKQSISVIPELADENIHDGGALLSKADDMESVAAAVRKLGYELSADDLGKVYEEFRRIVTKKEISMKDLDAIVATTAQQAPPVYRLKSFVINSGNIITSMAHIVLEKDGEDVQGFSMGDGPIDAAFLSIENIVGRHFELDDFQISAVTEGREAVGSSIVRLRSNGKLYSGKGVSTDIIGAGIRAYVNALNKICSEEEEKE